jgi:ABC-type multidrug transport system ATPase subunit
MRRRLDIAASLVGRPAVIFHDEPATGLDLPGRQALWQILAGLTRHLMPGPS